MNELNKQLSELTHNVIYRGGIYFCLYLYTATEEEVIYYIRIRISISIAICVGRYDIRLPDFVVEQLNLQSYLEPILSKLRSVMGTTPRPVIRTQNLVFVPVGSPPQEWHCDDTIKVPKAARYFTILIHLNPIDSMSGGTEIWMQTAKKGDLVSLL